MHAIALYNISISEIFKSVVHTFKSKKTLSPNGKGDHLPKFEAVIKKITSKSLASLDKGNEIILQFNDDNEILKQLVDKHSADKTVVVNIE